MLEHGGPGERGKRAKPERDHGRCTSATIRRPHLIAKELGHVTAEPEAELARKECEHASEQALRPRASRSPAHVANRRTIVRTAGDFINA